MKKLFITFLFIIVNCFTVSLSAIQSTSQARISKAKVVIATTAVIAVLYGVHTAIKIIPLQKDDWVLYNGRLWRVTKYDHDQKLVTIKVYDKPETTVPMIDIKKAPIVHLY